MPSFSVRIEGAELIIDAVDEDEAIEKARDEVEIYADLIPDDDEDEEEDES
jgi:hypothetical protein